MANIYLLDMDFCDIQGSSDDIVIISDHDNSEFLLKYVTEDGNFLKDNIFQLKNGTNNYCPMIFAKYIQYSQKIVAPAIHCHSKKATTILLFEKWESIVNKFNQAFWDSCLEEYKALSDILLVNNFFTTSKNHWTVLGKLIKYFHESFFSLSFLDDYIDGKYYKYEDKCKIINQHYNSNRFNNEVDKFTDSKKIKYALKILSKSFNVTLYESYDTYFYKMSSICFNIASTNIMHKNYPVAVLFCHRSLHYFLFFLLKKDNIKVKLDARLMDAYHELIANGHLLKNVEKRLEYINTCRNKIIHTHGECKISEREIKNMILMVKDILSEVYPNSKTDIYTLSPETFPKLNYLDIFKDSNVDSFIKKCREIHSAL